MFATVLVWVWAWAWARQERQFWLSGRRNFLKRPDEAQCESWLNFGAKTGVKAQNWWHKSGQSGTRWLTLVSPFQASPDENENENENKIRMTLLCLLSELKIAQMDTFLASFFAQVSRLNRKREELKLALWFSQPLHADLLSRQQEQNSPKALLVSS